MSHEADNVVWQRLFIRGWQLVVPLEQSVHALAYRGVRTVSADKDVSFVKRAIIALHTNAPLTVLHGQDTLAVKDLLLGNTTVKNVVEDRASNEITFFSTTDQKR